MQSSGVFRQPPPLAQKKHVSGGVKFFGSEFAALIVALPLLWLVVCFMLLSVSGWVQVHDAGPSRRLLDIV